jgi:Sulfotransferase family
MTPRTACTAVGDLLCTYYNGEFIPSEDILDSRGFISVQKKHSTLPELLSHKLLKPEEAQSLLKIAAVRNPFDSLASLYVKQRLKYSALLSDRSSWVNRSVGYAKQMRYARTHSFNQWIFTVCYRKAIKRLLARQVSMFAGYTQGMDVVLRYESIEKDLKQTFSKAGIPWKAGLPTINRTDERTAADYRALYSPSAAFIARFVYAYDSETYGYEF